ncbi:MAG: RNA polymerase sigma factor [Chitinophagaceae bacterium]|nr:RNA polymerase sigma factor [Chitinophagaceae bacterium]
MNDDAIDLEHVNKVRSGDLASFQPLITKYKDILFTYTSTILTDTQLAEETVQDAFVNAFKYLKTFQGKSSFKTWLIKITINEANKKRKQIKQHIILKDKFNENCISNEESQEVSNDVEIIKYALKLIDRDKSLALRLFYLDEYSINEIAKLTSWSIPKTKTTLHRAKKEIIKIVKEIQSKNRSNGSKR